jgi:hypothetical protein
MPIGAVLEAPRMKQLTRTKQSSGFLEIDYLDAAAWDGIQPAYEDLDDLGSLLGPCIVIQELNQAVFHLTTHLGVSDGRHWSYTFSSGEDAPKLKDREALGYDRFVLSQAADYIGRACMERTDIAAVEVKAVHSPLGLCLFALNIQAPRISALNLDEFPLLMRDNISSALWDCYASDRN